MKHKAVGIIGCVVILIVGIINWPGIFHTEDNQRYHQHLDAPKKEACTKDHSPSELCSHLPLIEIDTEGKKIPGARRTEAERKQFLKDAQNPGVTDRITAHMEIDDSEKEYNHISDEPAVSSDIVIHVRGYSSRRFDKLGYRIKLVDEKGENNPQSLMGMDAHDEWALHGPFLDKTLLRNYMMYNIAGEIMDYSPNVRFCELVLNGEYMGVYVLTELISEGKDGSRLQLSVNEKNETYTGYLLRLDRKNNDISDWLPSLTTYSLRNDTDLKLDVEFPSQRKLTEKMRKSINDDFSQFEKALYSYDYDNKKFGYKNYIDMDSFAEYFIINEATVNYDAGSYSTYIYKDVDRKLKMCVWDFNNACDNYQEQSLMDVQHFNTHTKLWFEMLIKDEDFVGCVIQKYRCLRKDVLSEEYLDSYIDDVVEYLGPAIDRNFEKWGYTFNDNTLLDPASRNIHSYDEAINQLKSFFHVRLNWMDDNIESLKQYCAESKIKKYNEVNE